MAMAGAMQLSLVCDLAVDTPLPSGHAFLSAASGLVVCGSALYVVADDAQCLGVFDLEARGLEGGKPGRLIPLIAGDLPGDAAARKKLKPDFEILLALPSAGGTRLLALGSGSTGQRMRGVVVDLPGDDAPASDAPPGVRLIDLRALLAAIAPLVPEINLEGAVLRGEELLLFNRGNSAHPASQVIAVPLAEVLEGGPVTARLCTQLRLPDVAGVPLTVTDACLLASGHILLSAAAEATDNS